TLNRNLTFFLEKEGYQVDSCLNGEDALYYLQEGSPDLILLDRMLPLLDGMEVLKKIRQAQNRTPVLMLTALGTLADKVDGLDAGADDYLVKPFAMEELLARIRSLCRR
ncbi:MAG: response regulator, partial [Acetatifactor sp.]|nr:response regulator [Acetatifactor sp.]